MCLIESKSTIHKSLSVKHAWLRKIAAEASAQNLRAGLAIQFVDRTGRPVQDGSWIMLQEQTFRAMLDNG